ncbi:MAG: peptidoglycan-binding protein [Rhodospirillaceae bacterium]|nr:peptidoglycan-binding protein [Rhodospirillaceae bacterium]
MEPDNIGRAHAGDLRREEDLEGRRRLVRRVQQLLLDKGYEPGPVDGLWGPRTASALAAFQLENGLDSDGVLGPKTLDKLFDER